MWIPLEKKKSVKEDQFYNKEGSIFKLEFFYKPNGHKPVKIG